MSSRKKNPGLPLNSEVTQIAIALNLTGPQTAILRHISASMSRKSPVCFKSQETLARETRYCKRTISNAIKSLVDMNILLIENRVINGARHHNIYRCNHDENGWHVAEIKGASDALRIPVQISHPFHCKPATDSIASQPPIPVESGR